MQFAVVAHTQTHTHTETDRHSREGKREFREATIARLERLSAHARESDYAKVVLILNDRRTTEIVIDPACQVVTSFSLKRDHRREREREKESKRITAIKDRKFDLNDSVRGVNLATSLCEWHVIRLNISFHSWPAPVFYNPSLSLFPASSLGLWLFSFFYLSQERGVPVSLYTSAGSRWISIFFHFLSPSSRRFSRRILFYLAKARIFLLLFL